MFAEDRFSGIMRVVRALGAVAVFMIALAGAPQAATANECEPNVEGCLGSGPCLDLSGNECTLPGECEAVYVCEPAVLWDECSESQYPTALVCMEDEPD